MASKILGVETINLDRLYIFVTSSMGFIEYNFRSQAVTYVFFALNCPIIYN